MVGDRAGAELPPVLDTFVSHLDQEPALRGLFLGGSHGRGTADAFSDIDLIAICAPDAADKIVALWRETLDTVVPPVFWRQVGSPGRGFLINATTEDWLRLDFYLIAPDRFVNRSKATLIPLIDRDGAYQSLPATIPSPGPRLARLTYIVEESFRVAGLFGIGLGRGELVTGVQGVGLLHGLLTDLMQEQRPEAEPGGVLHLSRLLDADDFAILAALPRPQPDRDEIIAAFQAAARAFLPRARDLLEGAGGTWPDAFEAATRAYLRRTIGADLT